MGRNGNKYTRYTRESVFFFVKGSNNARFRTKQPVVFHVYNGKLMRKRKQTGRIKSRR